MQLENRNYCHCCCNACVEPELNHKNDLSYISVGKTDNEHGLHIRSGDNKPTALIITKWDKNINQNIDVGIYEMKYCPECGRKLIENTVKTNSDKERRKK